MAFECVVRTDVGLKRKVNEDSVLERTERGLWAVADGMGGHEAGDVASAMVTDALHSLPIIYGLEELVEAAIDQLHRVNRQLIDLARTQGSERSIGTTVVALAIADGHFHCFWAGDSRAYRVRDGAIRRISRDHSMVQDLVDAGMLAADEAEGHVDANVITRAVGATAELEFDSSTGDALPGDVFLLASDGLTRLVNDQEILAQLTTNGLDDAADTLIEMVMKRGAPDNVSIIITKVNAI